MGIRKEENLMSRSQKPKMSTREPAKGAGTMENATLCRKLVAELFEPIWGLISQGVSVIINFGLLDLWDCPTAHANAAGFVRIALPAVGASTGFSKPMRGLTEHHKTESIPAFDYGDRMNNLSPSRIISTILDNHGPEI